MPSNNKYIYRSRITESKFKEIVKYFFLDLDTKKDAIITLLNRNTVNQYLAMLRKRIAEFCETETPFTGEVEVNESYFDAKKGRGTTIKTLTILQNIGKIYTKMLLFFNSIVAINV